MNDKPSTPGNGSDAGGSGSRWEPAANDATPVANPTGQNPAGQNPTGQNPAGQNPAGQNPAGEEPAADAGAAATPGQSPEPIPERAPAPVAAVPAAASSPWGAVGGRGKAAVAGVAAALLIGGGVTGFGIGHATGDSHDRDGEILVGFNGQPRPDGDRDGDREGGREGGRDGDWGGDWGGFGGPGGPQVPGGAEGQPVPVQPGPDSDQLPS